MGEMPLFAIRCPNRLLMVMNRNKHGADSIRRSLDFPPHHVFFSIAFASLLSLLPLSLPLQPS